MIRACTGGWRAALRPPLGPPGKSHRAGVRVRTSPSSTTSPITVPYVAGRNSRLSCATEIEARASRAASRRRPRATDFRTVTVCACLCATGFFSMRPRYVPDAAPLDVFFSLANLSGDGFLFCFLFFFFFLGVTNYLFQVLYRLIRGGIYERHLF